VAISIEYGPPPNYVPIKKQNTFSGTATHTGKYDCVLYYWIQPTSLGGGILYGIDGRDATLISANGDEIWFDEVTGTYTFREGNPGVPGIVDGTININIVGGTGRFDGATGSIVAVVEQEYSPVEDPTPTTGTWTGQIEY
jgi:hypothetical protein